MFKVCFLQCQRTKNLPHMSMPLFVRDIKDLGCDVERKLPNTRIIVGGSEVTIESKYLLNKSVIDVGCIGEGY